MDWEFKIIEVCDKLGIDTQLYNSDDEVRELVSKTLGFSSFESFNAFPESSAIVDGRGLSLKQEHYAFQLVLCENCCQELRHQYNISQNLDELERQISRTLNYFENNFQFEMLFVSTKMIAEKLNDIIDVETLPCYQLAMKKFISFNSNQND